MVLREWPVTRAGAENAHTADVPPVVELRGADGVLL